MSEKQFDAIVIGSGIGGLSCAASLAMCNYKVLVLEKNPSLGGSMAGFTEPESGNWNWSPGIQWVCDDLTISFQSLLNKEYQDPEYQTAEMHHETRYEYFEKYEGQQDSETYKKLTEQITRNYLDRLEERFPGCQEFYPS